MFVIMGTVTADILVKSDVPLAGLGGDGFTTSNLVFTEAPVSISMGGNGGNSAYVLAGLGVQTALCGAVGQDLLGDVLVGWLQAREIDLTGLFRSATHATSCSTIIMTDAANQVVYHHLGSTADAAIDTMPLHLFESADALLVSSFPLMTKLRRGGFAHALALTHRAGGLTALDIGPFIGDAVTMAEISPLLPTVDYLIANTHELLSLTGAVRWADGANALLDAGARNVVIKQGAQGASIWTSTTQVHVPGFRVEANISVGAGDSFNVGLLYGLQQGWPAQRALRFANAVAALVVASPRGVLGSPTISQVEGFLHENA